MREEGEKHQVHEERITAWRLWPSIRAERRGSIQCKEKMGEKKETGRSKGRSRKEASEGRASRKEEHRKQKERKEESRRKVGSM